MFSLDIQDERISSDCCRGATKVPHVGMFSGGFSDETKGHQKTVEEPKGNITFCLDRLILGEGFLLMYCSNGSSLITGSKKGVTRSFEHAGEDL